jgi:hypothetical protein
MVGPAAGSKGAAEADQEESEEEKEEEEEIKEFEAALEAEEKQDQGRRLLRGSSGRWPSLGSSWRRLLGWEQQQVLPMDMRVR